MVAVVAKFLADALTRANQEEGTLVWFALQTGPSTFARFDAFADDEGRKAHLAGPIAAALMGRFRPRGEDHIRHDEPDRTISNDHAAS